jgi:hypothetical protein
MRAISNLFAAFTNLAASVNVLSGVLDVATGRLRPFAFSGEESNILHGVVIVGQILVVRRAVEDGSEQANVQQGKALVGGLNARQPTNLTQQREEDGIHVLADQHGDGNRQNRARIDDNKDVLWS